MSQDKERDAFERRMLDFGWRNFTGDVQGEPPCWYYANADLNARWIGWREARAALASQQAETPDENNQWIAEAKKTLDHLAGFLYRIGAPHKVNWRDWIDSAEKHLASQQAVKGEPQPSAQGPDELWLQLHGDCLPDELSEPVDYTNDDVTWCWHQIHDSDVRYVRADLASPPSREPQWQPIETAPKDGTLIVLGARNGVWLGKYLPIYQSGYRPDNPWSSMMLNHDHMAERRTRPTHWMPLPPPPGIHSRGEGEKA